MLILCSGLVWVLRFWWGCGGVGIKLIYVLVWVENKGFVRMVGIVLLVGWGVGVGSGWEICLVLIWGFVFYCVVVFFCWVVDLLLLG